MCCRDGGSCKVASVSSVCQLEAAHLETQNATYLVQNSCTQALQFHHTQSRRPQMCRSVSVSISSEEGEDRSRLIVTGSMGVGGFTARPWTEKQVAG